MIVSGPRAGERVALRHGFMIGKVAGCDLVIEDGYTSTHHAQVMVDPAGNCRLFDYGSTNGTFVNGVRITDHPLEHGASIRIGSTELRFLTQ
jgi:pSer/pThr/pTyr-binding forkhead associated (FHA) protein